MNDITQDIDKFFLNFETENEFEDPSLSEIINMIISDNNDTEIEKIKIPWYIYDDLLSIISENSVSKEYSVITLDLPLTSTLYKYNVVMMNCEEYMIIRKYSFISKKLINEFFITYNNIY